MSDVTRKAKLSRQEEQVLLLSMSGLGDREVGEALNLSTETVRTYWKRIRKKVEGGTRAEIIAQLSQRGVRAELEAQQVENELLLNEIKRRKEAEARLRFQLGIFESITGSTSDAIFLLDHRGRITFSNKAATDLFGWDISDLTGKVFHDVMHHHHPDGRPYPIGDCPLQLIFSAGKVVRKHEDQFFHKVGHLVPVSCSNAPIHTEGGTGAVLIVRSTAEELASKSALQDSELKRRSMHEAALNPILLIDRQGIVLEKNRAVLTSLSYTDGDILGKPMAKTILAGTPQKLEEIFVAIDTSETWEGEIEVRGKDGSRVKCYGFARRDKSNPDHNVWITLRPEIP